MCIMCKGEGEVGAGQAPAVFVGTQGRRMVTVEGQDRNPQAPIDEWMAKKSKSQ